MARTFNPDKVYRLFIVEDHDFTLTGIREAVKTVGWIDLVGVAKDGEEALRNIPQSSADLVLMDLALPKVHGIKVTSTLVREGYHGSIIWFSASPSVQFVELAREYGVKGVLHKSCRPTEIICAFEEILGSHEVFSRTIFPCLPENPDQLPGVDQQLSNRQKEVLILVGKGFTSKEIADILHTSVRTVDTYREQVCEKLCLRNQADMARVAVQQGLI